ncbi:MAG: DnaJ domain-containing protein [Gemmatimonadota bacterium]|nr:DnaJ domain-containing protein [Gemmatimonadota bacterium]
MNQRPFVDYYEVLQLSQCADAETVERVFRLLAKRYHPDNPESGDDARFREVHEAYEVLHDPERRVEYDVQYDRNCSLQWRIFDQGSALSSHEEDRRIFEGVLSLLYAARRQNPQSGGLGSMHLERMLGVPREHLEFPLWVLKKRGWIETLDTGEVAITIDGIDQICAMGVTPPDERLLEGGAPLEQAV